MPKKTLSTRPGSVYARKWYARNPTGKVRGGLCKNCNRGLGAFLDDPRLLRNAIAYLMKG